MTERVAPTWTGLVRGIYTVPEQGARPEPRAEVRAIAGGGLEGDRYGGQVPQNPPDQLTLIESEALAAAASDYGLVLEPGGSRRNIETEGVPLSHLVGREFWMGEVRVRGVELCEPCGHLQQLTGRQIVRALRHRGGLRAEILEGGMIRTGDAVKPLDPS